MLKFYFFLFTFFFTIHRWDMVVVQYYPPLGFEAESQSAVQTGLKLMNLLSQLPKCWYCRKALSLTCAVASVGSRSATCAQQLSTD